MAALHLFPPWRIYTIRVHMPENTTRDTVILGSGCSGLTAAIYAARSNLKPLVFEGHEPGGQLSITTLVENFPGWPEGIQGPELIENMKKQAVRFGAELRMAHLSSVDLTKHPIELTVGKEIAVIGGGDSAMEEALFLTRFATKVTLINRSERFRASKIMLERAMAHPSVKFLSSTTVEEVLGVEEKDVKGLRLKSRTSGDEYVLPVSAMFLGIGHIPNAAAFKGMMDLDPDGYIVTKNNVFTTLNGEIIPGVFACGDIQDRRYRQAITAAGTGCMAALEVEKYLEEHGR